MEGYEKTFAEFDDAGGAFVWQWNWTSFALGPIWYFAKGLQRKGAFWLMIAGILCASLGFSGVWIAWVATGLLGSYDLYLKARHNETRVY